MKKFTPSIVAKLTLALALLLFFTNDIRAQNPTLNDANEQLRQLFSPLSRPNPSKWFLYDMAAHVTDSIFFDVTCKTPNDLDTWYKVYEEMYHSAYDTSTLLTDENIYNAAHTYKNDTIPIGIMNYDFFRLKPDALTTNNYFNFDTVNTILTDIPSRPNEPYSEASIFMASPLYQSSHFRNPIFRIDPQFILYDVFNQAKYSNMGEGELRIDFGDGNGWVTFDPQVVTNFQVTYPDNRDKIITTAIFIDGQMRLVSHSVFRIVTGAIRIEPDEVIDLPGIRGGFYNGCNADRNSGKTVIYLSGIDIMEDRGVEQIYQEMLQNDRIIQLKNDGYNFLVVDWKNSRIDMRFNALYLLNLIEERKCTLADDQQFVMIGESMGGVIGRYLLTYMETGFYTEMNTAPFFEEALDINNAAYLLLNNDIFNLPTNWCRREKMHNTRLFITLDAPHQGANIPLSYQLAYKAVMDKFSSYIGIDTRMITRAFNLFLDGQAAQQLLIYHVDTKSGGGWYYNYNSHSDRVSFMRQLRDLGNYPRFAKVVAMSNGALSGQGQNNPYTNQIRVANDRLIDFHTELFARILWFKIPIFGGDLEALTNPNGNGKSMKANAGFYSIRIKLKWFGIKIHIGYNSWFYEDENVNSLPFCVSAGSFQGEQPVASNGSVHSWNLSENYWALNLVSYYNEDDGQGCRRIKAHLGWNGFASGNFSYSLCSDGTHFGFVPVQSALDYGVLGTIALDHDIETENINTKLSRIAEGIDVMIGYPNRIRFRTTNNSNYPHLNMRNTPIRNIDESGFFYHSCGATSTVERAMLNLEIGDEELYLENVTLPWRAVYQAEWDVLVNVRNPYYEYPTAGGILEGAYSKQEPYLVDDRGFATFLWDNGGTNPPINGVGFRYEPPFSQNTNNAQQPLLVCCRNFIGQRQVNVPMAFLSSPLQEEKKKKPVNDNFSIFPNPNNGETLNLRYRFLQSGMVTANVRALTGQLLLTKQFSNCAANVDNSVVLNLSSLNLSRGTYVLQLSNGKELKTSKLILTK